MPEEGLYSLKDWEELSAEDKKEIIEDERERQNNYDEQLRNSMKGWDSCNV